MSGPIHQSTYYSSTSNRTIDKNSPEYKAEIKRLRKGSLEEQNEYCKITGKAPTWQGRVVDQLISGEYTCGMICFLKGIAITLIPVIIKTEGVPFSAKVISISLNITMLFSDVAFMVYKTYRNRDQD
jgi:hypothetical protein